MAFPATPLPLAVELQLGGGYLLSGAAGSTVPAASNATCYTADKLTLDITGDMDVRFDGAAVDWTPPTSQALASKNRSFGLVSADWSWDLRLLAAGTLQFSWSPDGTWGSALSATSTAAVGAANGTRKAVRVSIDVNNGSSQREIRFYTADTIAGVWSQLGSTVTQAGVTSVGVGAARLEVGTVNDGNPGFGQMSNFTGKIYGVEVYNTTVRVASPNFTVQAAGASSFADAEGNEWLVSGSSVIARDWVDVTAGVLSRGQVAISGRGRAGEAARADGSSCTFELGNTSGDFSLRNPSGAYYGVIGRNTPLRVSTTAATTFAEFARGGVDYLFCRDTAGLSVTGDIDIRFDLYLPSWQGLPAVLGGKYVGATQHSWVVVVTEAGQLGLVWSADGANDLAAGSTLPVPLPHYGRKSVRVTLDVDNGAAGRTATFYTGSGGVSGSWTQLGDPVVTATPTSIFDSSAEVWLCGYPANYTGGAHARLYGFLLMNGIAGTAVSTLDMTNKTAGARTATDTQGNVWYLAGTSEIVGADRRFVGEVSEWPVERDTSGNDVWVPITGAGVMRRLGQGASPLGSTLYRGLVRAAGH